MSQRNDYTAGAGQTIFTFTFQIFENDEIQVYQNGLLLALGIDYTVTIDTLPSIGGSITLTSGATAGATISLVQAIPFTRLISYQTDGDWQADTVNADFNRLYTLLVQAFGTSSDPNDQISDRLLRFATSENRSGATNLIPSPQNGTILSWNNNDLINIALPTFSSNEAVTVNSATALRAVDINNSHSAYLEGQNTPNDGGQNHFYYDAASTAIDNNLTVVTPDSVGGGPGRWLFIQNLPFITDDSITPGKVSFAISRRVVFDSNGVYTPNPKAARVTFEVYGAGGGGGGCTQGSGINPSTGGSGGGGGYVSDEVTSIASSYTITIGQGGSGGTAGGNSPTFVPAGGNGGAGTNSIVTDGASYTLTANGGNGGSGAAFNSQGSIGTGGNASGSDQREKGTDGVLFFVAGSGQSGYGAYRSPAIVPTSGAGVDGDVISVGGSGGRDSTNLGGQIGGAGYNGRVIVTEYAAF